MNQELHTHADVTRTSLSLSSHALSRAAAAVSQLLQLYTVKCFVTQNSTNLRVMAAVTLWVVT